MNVPLSFAGTCRDCGTPVRRVGAARCWSCHVDYSHRRATERVQERFWARVEKSDGCWLWTGRPATATGYGNFYVKGRGQVGVHRLAYEMARGPIPSGMFVCHHCDVRLCVRPDHLFLGDAAANNSDMKAKGRHEHGDRHHGVRVPFAVVQMARQMRAAGGTYVSIGRALDVSSWTVRHWVSEQQRRATP